MTISFFLATLAQVLTIAILLRVLLSWFPQSRTLAPATVFLNEATDPILRPIQRRLPAVGPFDLSPLVAIMLIGVVESLVLMMLAGH